jgi:hypothetical protein
LTVNAATSATPRIILTSLAVFMDRGPDKPELKIEDCKLNICGCRYAPQFNFICLLFLFFLSPSTPLRAASLLKIPSLSRWSKGRFDTRTENLN